MYCGNCKKECGYRLTHDWEGDPGVPNGVHHFTICESDCCGDTLYDDEECTEETDTSDFD